MSWPAAPGFTSAMRAMSPAPAGPGITSRSAPAPAGGGVM
jgi:hypothetical protein